MRNLHAWRRTAAFKGTAWLLVTMLLSPTTTLAHPAGHPVAYLDPPAAPLASASGKAQSHAAPPLVPRRVRPAAVQVVSGALADGADAWRLFDGSGQAVLEAGGKPVRLRVVLPEKLALATVAAWASGPGRISVEAEDGDDLVAIDGLGDREVERGPARWQAFAARRPVAATAFVVDWEGRGGTLGELELWALDTPPRGAPADAADELYRALPERAVELRAAPEEARIATGAGADGASVTLALVGDPRSYERAFLIYELEGLPHWTFVPRQINAARTANARAGFDDAGAGGLQVEEISPAWLQSGANQVRFLPVAGHDYTVRHVRLALLRADEMRAEASAGAQQDGRGFAFAEAVQPQHVAFLIDRPGAGHIELSTAGRSVRVELEGLSPGWHWRAIDPLPPSARVDARLPGEAWKNVSNLTVSASRLPALTSGRRLVVTYPRSGECAGGGVYLRGFVEKSAGPGGDLAIAGHATPLAADGSFAVAAALPAGPARDSVAVEWRDGELVRRSVAVGPCLDGPHEVADPSAPGGTRPLAEDVGAPFGAVVPAGAAQTLSFAGATIDVPEGATDRDVRITIRPLTETQVRPMDELMENVIAGGRAFRFGPRGMVFRKPVKITLPFDASRLPPQTTGRDVFTYYYDEARRQWHRVGRVGMAGPGQMTSLTEHFTDFVNAARPVPEHPTKQLFNPTTIKDLKAADPADGIDVIKPPAATSTGVATLSYPIEHPPTRNVAMPPLQFTYSSDRGNGWLGVGWDLNTSTIEIDTKFGVPLYNGTDRYVLDGAMLTGPDPTTGEFQRRIEGRFDRIQRLGSDPTSYTWVVTDKDGTRSFYGESPAARLADPAPDRPPVIFRWYLERIEDVFGNRIELSYTRDAGSNGEPWVQVYPARIAYTSHPSGLPAEYSVSFALEAADRGDVIISGRSGFQVLTRKRLDFVDVKLGDDVIRRYDVRYQTGDFGKSLVASIAHLGLGARQELYEHAFAYHAAPRQGSAPDLFGPAQTWGQVQNAGGGARSADGLTRSDDSMSGGSGSVGFGFGPFSATVSAGGFSGDDRMRLNVFDRHGDGLPDFLDASGGGSRNLLLSTLPTTGSLAPEAVSGLADDSLGHVDRTGMTVSGGLNLGGLLGAAASYSRATAEDTRIVTDLNGDGFPDLLAGSGGQAIVRLGDGKNFGPPQRVGDLSLRDIVLGRNDRRAASDQKLHRIDPLIRWAAPFDGLVTVGGVIQRLASSGDGSIARIFHNGDLVWERLFGDNQPCEPAPDNRCGGGLVLAVAAGDRIYAELEAAGAPATEDVSWDLTVGYLVDAALAGLREPSGAPIYRFSQREDHRLVGRPTVPWVATAAGHVTVGGAVRKQPTSDDVTIQVVKRDRANQNPSVLFRQDLPAALDAVVPVSFDLAVTGQETVTFEVVSDTTVDPLRVAWTPSVVYTSYCRVDPRTAATTCGAVSCSSDAQGRPVVCSIANDPFPQNPIPGAVIAQDAQVYHQAFQTLPATATATLVRSGAVTIGGNFVKDATAAPVAVLVQGVNRLLFKRVFAAGEVGTFPVAFTANLGTSEQLFFTVASALDPRGAVSWAPTVDLAPAPVNVRFRDPAFADPLTGDPRDPMSGGYHRWFFGDWDGETPFNEAGIVFPDPQTTNTFMFVAPQRQGTATVPVPLWIGRGEGEIIADGLLRPARLASSSTLAGGGNGGLDDLRIAESWSFNLGASVLGVGVDATTGDSTTLVDLFDMNGDRFPDSVFADGVRFNDGAAFGSKTPIDFGLGDLRRIEQRGLRARAGASGTLIDVTNSAGETKALVSTGFNAGTEYSMSATQVDFIDINGDGLPDHVEQHPGEGAIVVRLNLGYKFGQPIAWPTAPWASHSLGSRSDILRSVFGSDVGSDVVRLADTGTNNIGVGGSVGIIEGGAGLSFTASRGLVDLVDVNGDGLPDQVLKLPDEHNVLRVKLNLGDHFAPEEHWPIPGWDGINVDPPDFQFLPGGDALSFHRAQQISFSLGATVCFVVCFGGSAFTSQGPSWQQLMFEDIDGDGRVDHVLKVDGNAQVYTKLNQVGKSNLLKTVFAPLGGTIELDYKRDGNRVDLDQAPRVDMPQNQWVLASATTTDGRGNQYQNTFDYLGSGLFDRVEREFFGFAHVVTTRSGDGSQLEEFFHNQDYYRRGHAFRTIEKDAAGNLFAADDVVYREPPTGLLPLTGSFFPAAAVHTTQLYEGTTTDPAQPVKSTAIEVDYDDTGNLTSSIDRGEPGAADDAIFSVTWRRDAATHIMRPTHIEGHDGGGALLRARDTSYRADGTVDTMVDTVAGGKDASGTPYVGSADRNLIRSFSFDALGNLAFAVDPSAKVLAYEYDARMRLYRTATFDSFGYRSTSVPDYRFGVAAEDADVNGQRMVRVFDDFGRIIQVFGPNEVGGTEPTLRMDFGIQPGAAPFPAWVVTRNKDDARPGDPLVTATFVDGLGRNIETKKDAEVEIAGGTRIGMTVSGRVEFDGRARVSAQGQPIFDTGAATAFIDVPLRNPTRTEYDILNRPTRVTTPDGGQKTFQRDFAALDGKTFLRESFTDPDGETTQTLRTARGEVAAVIQRNTVAGQLASLTTRYQYDALSQLTTVIDAAGNSTVSEHDTLGRQVAMTSPDSGRTEWRFDASGNLAAKETANLRASGDLIRYFFTFDRLDRVVFPDHPAIAYSYGPPWSAGDANGNRASRVILETSEAGTREQRYDRLGNIVDELATLFEPDGHDDPLVTRTQYRFDSLGRLLQMTFPGRGGEVVSYGYDAGGLLSSAQGVASVPEDLDHDESPVTSYLLHAGYDEFGQRVRLVYGNAIDTSFGYDPFTRRLATVDASHQDDDMRKRNRPPVAFQALRYQYDLAGNVLQVKNDVPVPSQSPQSPQVGPAVQNYHYDHLHQLVSADGLYQAETGLRFRSSFAVAYDGIGNLVRKDQQNIRERLNGNHWDADPVRDTTYSLAYLYGGPRPHAPTEIDEPTAQPPHQRRVFYRYDANGNRQARFEENEQNPDPQFTWDSQDQLKAVHGPAAHQTMLYDAAGARSASQTDGHETVYVNQYLTITNDRVFSKHIFAGPTRIATKIEPQVGARPRTFFYHPDHLQSAHVVSDEDQTLSEHHEYFPSGEVWIDDGDIDQFGPQFRFNGKELDAATGFYYFGARYYDPRQEQWIAPDPALAGYLSGNAGGGGIHRPGHLGVYSYTLNNPAALVDPTGAAETGAQGPWMNVINQAYQYSYQIQKEFHDQRALTDPAAARARYDALQSEITTTLQDPNLPDQARMYAHGAALYLFQGGVNSGIVGPKEINGTVLAAMLSVPSDSGGLGLRRPGMGMASGPRSRFVPTLPEYDGVTTHGVLVTNEGQVIRLQSGNADPRYSNYAAAGHVEGKAAILLRDLGSSGGTLYHNNTNGTCGYCDRQIRTLLPENSTLQVYPPANAVPNNSRAVAVPKPYTGNSAAPKTRE